MAEVHGVDGVVVEVRAVGEEAVVEGKLRIEASQLE